MGVALTLLAIGASPVIPLIEIGLSTAILIRNETKKVNPAMIQQSQVDMGNSYSARIYMGSAKSLPDEKLYKLGGMAPGIQLFDEAGRPLTWPTPGEVVESGSHLNYFMKPIRKGVNQTPAYIKLEFNQTDTVCMSGVTVAAPDGAEVTITGSLLHNVCGWPGYPAKTPIVFGDEAVQPECLWAGSRGRDEESDSHTIPQMFAFHLQSFAGQAAVEAYQEDREQLCKVLPRAFSWNRSPTGFPVFKEPLRFPRNMSDINGLHYDSGWTNAYNGSFLKDTKRWVFSDGKPDPTFKPITHMPEVGIDKRGLFENTDILAQQRAMITKQFLGQYSTTNSTKPNHSAEYVCANLGTAGPDWANSHERKYCDLSARKVYEYCNSADQVSCWDEAERVIRGAESPKIMALRADAADEGGEILVKPTPIKKLSVLYQDFGEAEEA